MAAISNMAASIEFLQLASSGKARVVFDRCVHPGFTHHNIYFKGDRESLLTAMEENAKQFPNKIYEVLRALEDGELTTVHGKVVLGDKTYGVIHIFRFKDGKIIEAWEASQEDLNNSPNENGLF